MTCEELATHRLSYLEYEGPISDNRGAVARQDAGTYRIEQESEDQLVVELAGEKLRGRATLTRLDSADELSALQTTACHWVFAF